MSLVWPSHHRIKRFAECATRDFVATGAHIDDGDWYEAAAARASGERFAVSAVIALLEWAPPVAEKRPALPAPNAECVRRGLLVGAVVRWSKARELDHPEVHNRRATVVTYDTGGDPVVVTADGRVYQPTPYALRVVLPPPGGER